MLKSSTSKRKYRAPLTETIGVAPQRSTWMRPNCFIALEVDLSNGKRWLLANWQDSQTELLLSCLISKAFYKEIKFWKQHQKRDDQVYYARA